MGAMQSWLHAYHMQRGWFSRIEARQTDHKQSTCRLLQLLSAADVPKAPQRAALNRGVPCAFWQLPAVKISRTVVATLHQYLCLVLGYAAAALLIAWQQPVASSDPTAAPPALSKGSAHSQERLAVGAGDPLASGNAWGDDCFRRGWTTQPLW
jgi:hypothetical protein